MGLDRPEPAMLSKLDAVRHRDGRIVSTAAMTTLKRSYSAGTYRKLRPPRQSSMPVLVQDPAEAAPTSYPCRNCGAGSVDASSARPSQPVTAALADRPGVELRYYATIIIRSTIVLSGLRYHRCTKKSIDPFEDVDVDQISFAVMNDEFIGPFLGLLDPAQPMKQAGKHDRSH